MALKAGLESGMAMVWVGPPFPFRAPSLGLTPTLSVLFLANEHPAVFRMRLFPCETGPPEQSGVGAATLFATIVALKETLAPPSIPPPFGLTVAPGPAVALPATVEFTSEPEPPM